MQHVEKRAPSVTGGRGGNAQGNIGLSSVREKNPLIPFSCVWLSRQRGRGKGLSRLFSCVMRLGPWGLSVCDVCVFKTHITHTETDPITAHCVAEAKSVCFLDGHSPPHYHTN